MLNMVPADQSIDEEFWREAFTENPDVMYRLLGDVYRITSNADSTPSLDELKAILEPQYAQRPFTEAVVELLDGRSVRWLAQRMGMHHRVIQRFMTGERSILMVHDPQGSLFRLQQFAKALGVHPAYFREWRRLWILVTVDMAFELEPDLTVQFIERSAGMPPRQAGRPPKTKG